MSDLFGNLGNDLSSGSSVANNRDPFSSQVVTPIPSGTVHGLASKLVDTGNVWQFRNIQLTHRRNEEIGSNCVCAPKLGIFGSLHFDSSLPLLFCIVPLGRLDSSVETDVAIQLILVCYSKEVLCGSLLACTVVGRTTTMTMSRTAQFFGERENLRSISSCPGYSLVQSEFCSKE